MKDTQLHIRISTTEKEKFRELAEKEGMDLSTYFLTAAREKKLKLELRSAAPGETGKLLERMDQLEKQVMRSNKDLLVALQEVTPGEREELLLAAATDKVYWMLQQEQFQEETKEEVKIKLLQIDPRLVECLEESNSQLFTALDLALERLEKEEKVKIGRDKLKWN